MFSHISASLIYFLASATILAVATPWNTPTTSATVTTTVTVTATGPATTVTEPASQCNTGELQCCNSVQQASSPSVTSLFGLLGVVVSDLDVLVGVDCSPISVIGVGGSSCSATPVCCEDNNFNGLVAIGCVPVNLSL